MLTLIISLGLSLALFIFISSFYSVIGAILPALALLLASFFLISRALGKKLEGQMKSLQEDLMKGRIEQALASLMDIKARFARWQFFLGATIDGQIGSIFYMKGQFSKAKPFLEKAFVRHWVARAMLAIIYYRERKYDKMDECFEHVTKYVKKTGLLWCTWAYCHWRLGNIEKAINILAQGKSFVGEADSALTQNLLSLQNSKRMKMKAYGEQWYQFQLELSPAQTQMKQGRVRFASR
jgi:tetratricopeptide (TPR) repeat protein